MVDIVTTEILKLFTVGKLPRDCADIDKCHIRVVRVKIVQGIAKIETIGTRSSWALHGSAFCCSIG